MRRAPFSKRPSPGHAAAVLGAIFALLLASARVVGQDGQDGQDGQPTADALESECTCLWQGSFADVQADTDIVVAGTVHETKGNALDLAVEHKLRGDPYFEEIRVWLKTRNYCRPSIEDFPVGSRWVMALRKIREVPPDGFDPLTPNQSYGRVDDYILSECGGYWLSYTGEAVTGNLVDAPRWAREPEMQPVLISLIEAFVQGRADADALRDAARENPAVDELMLDTRAFLRGDVPIERP